MRASVYPKSHHRALMRFLPLACLAWGRDPATAAAEFKAIFDKVKLDAGDFTPDRFEPILSGQA